MDNNERNRQYPQYNQICEWKIVNNKFLWRNSPFETYFYSNLDSAHISTKC